MRHHLIVSGTDQAVLAEMWQRLPLLLGSDQKMNYVVWDCQDLNEASTYGLKYPQRIPYMLQPTTFPSRTVSKSMRIGRTLRNYRTCLGFHILSILI